VSPWISLTVGAAILVGLVLLRGRRAEDS
jgi:hypothetical protein